MLNTMWCGQNHKYKCDDYQVVLAAFTPMQTQLQVCAYYYEWKCVENMKLNTHYKIEQLLKLLSLPMFVTTGIAIPKPK